MRSGSVSAKSAGKAIGKCNLARREAILILRLAVAWAFSVIIMTDTDIPSIAQRRADILQRMQEAAEAAPSRTSAHLVAVSKQQPEERIEAMLETGQHIFGENRVQEAQTRWRNRRQDWPDLQLRLIGPPQSNKVVDAVALFDVIETLDRPKLVDALAKAITKTGRTPDILIQVNTGEEPQKAGVRAKDLPDLLSRAKSAGLNVTGLMCIPPAAEPAGPHFAFLAKLAGQHDLKTLSMGMSSDYETAIKFGATHVRVGSALFGARP